MPLIEQLLLEELLGVLQCGRVTGAHFAKELDQRGFRNTLFFADFPFRFLPKG